MSSIIGASLWSAAHLGSASILIFLRFLTSPVTFTWPEIDAPLMGTNASTFGAAGVSALGASTFATGSVTFTLFAGADLLSSPHAMMIVPPPRQRTAAITIHET